jgi:hypothetical protein
MKYIRSIFILVFVILSINFTVGQELISYEKLRSMSKIQINALNPLIHAKYAVDVYKINYTTKTINLELDTASGLYCVPLDENAVFPIMIYDHGTVDNRHAVPSEDYNSQIFPVIFASQGYMCVAPDYIGLGISKGIHPYIHPESEAWASIDLLKSVKSLEEIEPFHFNDQVFVTGYSQGGHASMATCRALQDEPELKLIAGAPMSGPYSVSKEMKSFTLGNDEYYFCAYLGSVLLTTKYAYPDLMSELEIEDILKPEYASLVREYEKEEIGLFSMNTKMISALSANGGKVLPKRMFNESILNEILTNPEHPVNKALKRMDVCNWVPEVPLKMLYCKADDQVTYRNAVYTDSLMNANGAQKVSSIDVNSSANHGGCVIPATVAMMTFFAIYQHIGTVGNDNQEIQALSISPNPVSDKLIINGYSENDNTNIKIYSKYGKLLINTDLYINNVVNVNSLNNGIYFIEINNNGFHTVKKFIVVK